LNVAVNGLKDVEILNVAVADHEGDIEFNISTDNKDSMKNSIFESRMSGTKIKVKAVRMSNLIQQEVDFLKMDIEGAESIVLNELDSSKKIELIKEGVIEYHHNMGTEIKGLCDFLNIFEKNGYLYKINAKTVKNRVYQDINIDFISVVK
jgi:FkbM family methyltransferase